MADDLFIQFLLGSIAVAFGGWASIVWWGVKEVVGRIDKISVAVSQLDNDLNKWVHSTEHRLTSLEEWRKTLNGR